MANKSRAKSHRLYRRAQAPGNKNTASASPSNTPSSEYCRPGEQLSPFHLGLIKGSAIAPELAAERGYRTIEAKAELKAFDFTDIQRRVPTLLIPLYNTAGKLAGYQHRPDTPRLNHKSGAPTKYETPRGARNLLDVHPALLRVWEGEVVPPLKNPSCPIIFSEGIRKADSAISIHMCAIGLLGVWGWRGRNPADGLCALADWENVALNGPDRTSPQGRLCLLAFDSDLMDKAAVYLALLRFKAFLEHRGGLVRIIYLPPGPHGEKVGLDDWIAARRAEGKDTEAIQAELLALAVDELRKPASFDDAGGDDTVKRPFRLTDDGVEYVEESDDGDDQWVRVCSRLKIAAQTCNERNEDWGRLLEFPDNKGVIHQWAMPAELLGGDKGAYESELYRLGLTIAPGPKASYRLKEYIQTQGDQSSFIRSVAALGWHNNSFIYPDQIFGAVGGEPIVHQPLHPVEHDFRTKGTLQEWQEHVAKPCEGNSRLITTVSMAFAAPLLYPTKSESGGLHWRGDSSRGKTTLAIVGGSVVGGGGHHGTFLRQWRATVNGLEGVATAHCDSFLALDEIAQILPRDAGLAAYMLANGQGKSRSHRGLANRPTAIWRTLFCSTGEVSLADKVAEDGRKITAGQELRVLDTPADAGGRFGCFEYLHGLENDPTLKSDHERGQRFADQLKKAAAQYYGTAIRAYLSLLTAHFDSSIAGVELTIKAFLAGHCPPDADAQVRRACNRFALIAAGGELAIRFAIVPWPQGAAIDAARICFEAWLGARPAGCGKAEEEAGIAQVRKFIELHGESRFALWDSISDDSADSQPRPTFNRAGFRRPDLNGVEDFYIFPQVFRDELCVGHDATQIAKALAARALLIAPPPEPNGKQRYAVIEWIPALNQSKRMYHLTSKILEEE